MPSSSRRRFLAAVSTGVLAGVSGCSMLGRDRPSVTASTLPQDTSMSLTGDTVYVADGDALPHPPSTTDTLADATAVLATADTDRAQLVDAFRAGTPVAIAGDNATTALRSLLESVRAEYSFGVETARARPVPLVVADPRGDTIETYTFVAEGGWNDSVLDPFGWALTGRLPECDLVPESAMEDAFEYAGATHIVGRLPTGETYAARSVASTSRQNSELFVRLRTKLHTGANDGYAIEEAVRETDLPDDQHIHRMSPNSHTENGVRIANVSDTARSTFGIELTPASPRARSVLTGCGSLRTGGGLAYDHRTSFRWKRDGLLDTDRHYGSATGRGEWSFTA